MIKCILCGEIIDEQEAHYTYNEFLHELDKDEEYVYCRKCKEILRSDRATEVPRDKIIRVEILRSDYHLPGFVFSIKKGCYIKPRKRKSFLSSVMDIGKILR
jgi:hypothetical protein